MSASKREEVSSHLRYIRVELREMHQMLLKDDLLPDLNEAKEVHAQLDALYHSYVDPGNIPSGAFVPEGLGKKNS